MSQRSVVEIAAGIFKPADECTIEELEAAVNLSKARAAVDAERAGLHADLLLFWVSWHDDPIPPSLMARLAEAGEGTLSLNELRVLVADAFAWRESRLQA